MTHQQDKLQAGCFFSQHHVSPGHDDVPVPEGASGEGQVQVSPPSNAAPQELSTAPSKSPRKMERLNLSGLPPPQFLVGTPAGGRYQ